MSDAAKSSPVVRRFHKPEDAGSNLAAATSLFLKKYGHTLDQYPLELVTSLVAKAKELEYQRDRAREDRDIGMARLRVAIEALNRPVERGAEYHSVEYFAAEAELALKRIGELGRKVVL